MAGLDSLRDLTPNITSMIGFATIPGTAVLPTFNAVNVPLAGYCD